MSAQSDDIDQHEEFWLEDGDTIFLVDDVFFKVHRATMSKNSSVLKDMFRLPIANGEAEGGSIDNPIRLPDVTYEAFEVVLAHAYHLRWPAFLEQLSGEALVQAIRVGHRYEMDELIVAVAQRAMKILPTLQWLALCHKFGLDGFRQRNFVAERDAARKQREAAARRAMRRGGTNKEASSLLPCATGEIQDLSTQTKHAWIFDAFIKAVFDFSIRRPFEEPTGLLSDSMRFHLLSARVSLMEGRQASIPTLGPNSIINYNKEVIVSGLNAACIAHRESRDSLVSTIKQAGYLLSQENELEVVVDYFNSVQW
ncbi:hypothetical protein BKA62DRAFT_717406 [Auriculariales sp. MPI-PUGE-AT-0066]|nr:hypothetical protein BKA62DRAFT_717406 [Auriculariales sp. MPI-PUGE-AT-0066]